MEDNKFSFCPKCGSTKIETLRNGRKWKCPDCSFDLYNNVASAVAVIITNNQGQVLFEKRAKEPRKGFLALPGGFTDPDESAEEAARRECREETGVEAISIDYVCSFPNTYPYKGMVYKTCDLFFTASLPPDYTLSAQEGEVQEFNWLPINTIEDIEQLPLAFPSARKALLSWFAKK